jgi:sugar phosphate permease
MCPTAIKTAPPDSAPESGNSIAPRAGESAVVWTLWLTYGAFYFCRTNLSVAVAAVPGLKSPIADGGLGLTANEVGWILASLKMAYGLGQLVNGQLAERVSPRVMLALGMFGSAGLNLLFGFSTGFYFLLFVWATNGFCQSLGWTPVMRVTANWVPIARRGKAIGIIGTGYQVTLGLTYLVAGQAAEWFGWRGALWVPAILLSMAGVFTLFALRESPNDAAATPGHDGARPLGTPARTSLAESLYFTLYNPTLWLLGLTLGLLNACRYGYLDWGLAHLVESRNVSIDKATLQFFVIAIGAVAGSYVAGWATDRFFGSRRAPVICVLMAMLGALSFAYDQVVRQSPAATVVLLVVIGFCIYGPQVLLVGTAPADLAHRGTSAAAAGFVNFMGYMGAATGDVVTGYYASPEHGGWSVAIYIWAGWAFAGSAITALLWNTTSRRVGLLSSKVPKLGAIAALIATGAVVLRAEQPLALGIATLVAAVCMFGSFRTRWAALPALAVAAAGVAIVFAGYVQSSLGVTWEQAAAMLGYGLAAIATLMVLLDREGELCESS